MSAEVTRAEFDALRAELSELRSDMAELVKSLKSAKKVKPEEAVSEELLYIISAVVAAYLGKKATIKFVRRTDDGQEPWRTQGRVTVAASHHLSRTKGW